MRVGDNREGCADCFQCIDWLKISVGFRVCIGVMSGSETSEHELGSDGMSCKQDPIAAKKLGAVGKRPRPKNDLIDMVTFESDIRALLDSRTTAPPLDFRGYGATKRTGGSRVLALQKHVKACLPPPSLNFECNPMSARPQRKHQGQLGR